MCWPIRSLTEGRGHDARQHRLAVFGGAGGQHACSIARRLGIKTVVIHRYSSILSAYGMALADVVEEAFEPSAEIFNPESLTRITARLGALQDKVSVELVKQGFSEKSLRFEHYLNMRYADTGTALMIRKPLDGDYEKAFLDRHLTEFTFIVPGRPIVVDDIRVRGVADHNTQINCTGLRHQLLASQSRKDSVSVPKPRETTTAYFEGSGKTPTPVYTPKDLPESSTISGPAIFFDQTQTIVILPGSTAIVLKDYIVIDAGVAAAKELSADVIDPVQLSVFSHRFMSIAEQMGRTLQKTSVSLNIRERLDFSCAIFGPEGGLVANAPHVPVHLGSMQNAVVYQHKLHLGKLKDGDVLLTNHPQAGGTHLPDLTVVTPVFDAAGEKIIFYAASRGHHRDIGGRDGISGNPVCTYLDEEGAMFKSFKLVSGGLFDEEGVTKCFVEDPAQYPGCVGSNSINDNLSDLKAQIAANQRGSLLIKELFDDFGTEVVQNYMAAIQKNAETAVRNFLKLVAQRHPGPLRGADFLDDGTKICLEVRIDPETGSADFDWTGTYCETHGNRNAPTSLVFSAIIYCLRCMINEDIPLNQGCLAPIKVIVEENTLISPSPSAAVHAGNAMTSMRLCDVILKTFHACAASQGCMNGISMYGGEKAKPGEPFAGYAFQYGETVCGGSGAGPTWSVVSGVHTHMTNTRVSDLEILEKRCPILVKQFSLRPNSGGKGVHPGGDGAIRAIEARAPVTFALSSERRAFRPYGMAGGGEGSPGRNLACLKMPDGKARWVNVGGYGVIKLECGEQMYIHTPGGGAWGALPEPEDHETDEVVPNGFSNGQGSEGGKGASSHYWRSMGSLSNFSAIQNEG